MNYFNNHKVLIWILVALLVLNISAIATMVYHIYFAAEKPARQEVSTEAPLFLKERMQLNDAQWKDFRGMHMQFRQDSREIFQELNSIRKEILTEISLDNPDQDKLYDLSEAYGEKHALLKKNTVDHFLEMKENISPEQERMMNMFIRNIMEHEGMGTGSGPRHGRGERHRFGKEGRNRN